MKIVIDIPDTDMVNSQSILNLSVYCIKGKVASVTDVLCNHYGFTQLPKGHGDLIDRKALMNTPYEKGGFVEWYDEIKNAPTIIEKDGD